jgi:hypothetical protein
VVDVSTVIADINTAIRADSGSVWTAAKFGDDCVRPVSQYPGQPLSLNFDDEDGKSRSAAMVRNLLTTQLRCSIGFNCRRGGCPHGLFLDQHDNTRSAGRSGRFTEGFDTRDLKDAKALLEELGT